MKLLEAILSIKCPEIRARALANIDKNKLDNACDNLSDAIESSFLWLSSPEGTPFWVSIFDAFISSSQVYFKDHKQFLVTINEETYDNRMCAEANEIIKSFLQEYDVSEMALHKLFNKIRKDFPNSIRCESELAF